MNRINRIKKMIQLNELDQMLAGLDKEIVKALDIAEKSHFRFGTGKIKNLLDEINYILNDTKTLLSVTQIEVASIRK